MTVERFTGRQILSPDIVQCAICVVIDSKSVIWPLLDIGASVRSPFDVRYDVAFVCPTENPLGESFAQYVPLYPESVHTGSISKLDSVIVVLVSFVKPSYEVFVASFEYSFGAIFGPCHDEMSADAQGVSIISKVIAIADLMLPPIPYSSSIGFKVRFF